MYKTPNHCLFLSSWNNHINLRQAGEDTPPPGYQYGPAVRDFYLVHIVTGGKGTFTKNGNKYHIQTGEAFLICPNEITSYKADDDDPWQYSFFAFCGDMAEDLLPFLGFSDKRPVIPMADPELLDIIRESALLAKSDPATKQLNSLTQLFRIIDHFKRNIPSSNMNEQQTNPYVQQAINYIQMRYEEDITVEGLADMLAINRSYFYRIFKNSTGMSPYEYLNTYRISIARTLLSETDLSIADIAISTGFASFSSFYRFFVQKNGIAPRKYRSLCRKDTRYNRQKNNK